MPAWCSPITNRSLHGFSLLSYPSTSARLSHPGFPVCSIANSVIISHFQSWKTLYPIPWLHLHPNCTLHSSKMSLHAVLLPQPCLTPQPGPPSATAAEPPTNFMTFLHPIGRDRLPQSSPFPSLLNNQKHTVSRLKLQTLVNLNPIAPF